jgi:hypothetical protein
MSGQYFQIHHNCLLQNPCLANVSFANWTQEKEEAIPRKNDPQKHSQMTTPNQ